MCHKISDVCKKLWRVMVSQRILIQQFGQKTVIINLSFTSNPHLRRTKKNKKKYLPFIFAVGHYCPKARLRTQGYMPRRLPMFQASAKFRERAAQAFWAGDWLLLMARR
jgi:hypothetical protein